MAPPPPIMHETFRFQNFSETTKGSRTKVFGTETKKISTENSDTPPPSPLLSIKIFRYRKKLSETQKGSSTKFFGTVRQKKLDGKA